MKRTILSVLCALALVVSAAPAVFAQTADEALLKSLRGALVKVHGTSQGWDINSPWNKENPRTFSQRGVVVRPGLVLTLAAGVADNLMIEVSEANSARRYPASLAHVDYAVNLALVKIEDEDLLARTLPLVLGEPVTIDDVFDIWQLGSTDLLERTDARVQKVFSSGNQLQLIAKTSISERGDGQAAIKDGALVGLVFSTRSSAQEAQFISIETIRQYLDDYDSGEYRGFPAGGPWFHRLLRDDLRAHFQVPAGVHGVVVSRVLPGRTGADGLQAGDAVTHLDGHSLDDEGMFVHPLHGRLHFYYLLFGQGHPGETMPAKIIRGGEPMEVSITKRSWPRAEQWIPTAVRDRRPKFLILGGMLIQELTRQSRVGSNKLQRYQSRATWEPAGERKRIVYVSRVLPDAANKGLDEIADVAILTVNGKTISKLEDILPALDSPTNGFHVFRFEGLEKPFVIKAAELDAVNQAIAGRYRIPQLQYLGEPGEEETESDAAPSAE